MAEADDALRTDHDGGLLTFRFIGGTMRTIVTLFLWGVMSFPAGFVHAQNWANTETKLTKNEFLGMYFELAFKRHENHVAVNSFNIISFYPNTSPSTALLVIVQTYNDQSQSTDNPFLREEIIKLAEADLSALKARFRQPVLSERWPIPNPAENLIIRHVRVNNLQDTLAVTINGVTSFNPSDFKAAELKVINAGGIWTR